MAGIYEERKEYGEAIEALERVVAEDPAHEGAHVGLMRLYAVLGRRREALGQYERLRDALSWGVWGRARGGDRTVARGDLGWHLPTARFAAGRWLPIGRAPVQRADDGKHNLPLARTSFIGRERETLEVKRLLGHDEAVDANGGWRLGQDAPGAQRWHRTWQGPTRMGHGW